MPEYLLIPTVEERLARERQAAATRRAEDERYAVMRRNFSAELPAILRGDVAAMERGASLVQNHYKFGVLLYPGKDHIGGWHWKSNTARVRAIVDLESFLERLHEFAHGISGPCPRKAPHHLHVAETFVGCLACEKAAWDVVRDYVPLTKAMAAFLFESVASYRAVTPGTPATVQAIDQLLTEAARRAMPKSPADARRELQLLLA